jgi:hypothetical protein
MAVKPNDNELILGLAPAPEPFTGRLKAPIVYSDQASRERQKKLELLFEHYNINALSEAKRWKALAYALACHLVPGMKVVKRAPRARGRPGKWKEIDAATLLVGVIDAIKRQKKTGTKQAARIAIQRYKILWPGTNNADSLVARYHEALKVISNSKARRS